MLKKMYNWFLVFFCLVFAIVYMYLQVYRYQRLLGKKNFNDTEVQKKISKDEIFQNFQEDPSKKENIENMTMYLLNIYFTQTEMESRQALKEFFLLVSLLKKNNGTETYTYLRNHISPYLCSKIMKSIDKGIVSTIVNLMEQACGTQFITKLVDALRRNEKIYFLGGSVLTLLAILLAYSDLFKDIAVSCTILEAIGGIKALYNYPYQFGSAVVLVSNLHPLDPCKCWTSLELQWWIILQM